MTTKLSIQEFRNLPKSERRQKRPRQQNEHLHQASFFDVLRFNERQFPLLRFVFAVPNAAKRNPQVANLMIREGLRSGCPDICLPFARRGYGGAFIENKFGKNKLSESQQKFRDHLLTENYCFKICYSVDQQIEFLEWYLNIELRK